MENLWLWLGSTVLYFALYLSWKRAWWVGPGWNWGLKRLAVIALLTLPININGHILTVFGNAVGEKSVWSVASLYQKAGFTFSTFTPLTYQDAGEGEKDGAMSFLGIPSVQRGAQVFLFWGIAPYQYASRGTAMVFAGLAGQQVAPNNVAVVGLGFAGDQRAGVSAQVGIGLGFHQKAGEKERWFGAFTELQSDTAPPATPSK